MPLFITEFAQVSQDAQGRDTPAARMPFLRSQTVNVGATSNQSTVLLPETTLVRLHTDVNCCVSMVGGEATATDMRLAAGQTEYFGVPANSGRRVHVITVA